MVGGGGESFYEIWKSLRRNMKDMRMSVRRKRFEEIYRMSKEKVQWKGDEDDLGELKEKREE